MKNQHCCWIRRHHRYLLVLVLVFQSLDAHAVRGFWESTCVRHVCTALETCLEDSSFSGVLDHAADSRSSLSMSWLFPHVLKWRRGEGWFGDNWDSCRASTTTL
eukprot:scaffold28851_cov56-Attheya_sp.AAC.5